MKKSISFLPGKKRRDLGRLAEMVLRRLPETEMIILYGSYARNEYVHYDERVEFGVKTTFQSDYDILVITNGISNLKAEDILYKIASEFESVSEFQTPVGFIQDDIKKVNSDLSERRFFYSQIKQEGVILYDSGRFKLARRRKLRFDEIAVQAQEYFDEKYERGYSFLGYEKDAVRKTDYRNASFFLHQACENFFHAISLVFTLDKKKIHDLTKLLDRVKKYSDELMKIFPQDTPEEERLFELLKAAYIEARYNSKFIVTEYDIRALTPKIERLAEVTRTICQARIKDYINHITKYNQL